MKTLTSDQISSISGDTTTLAHMLQITNAIGNVFYYTDCDIDIVVGSNTYKSKIGFDVSALVANIGTNLSTCTVDLILDDSAVNKQMIEAGLLDGAAILVGYVDWLHPSFGIVELFRGNLQTCTYQDGLMITFDVEPLLSRDLQLTVDIISSNCRVDLGDSRCSPNGEVDMAALKKTGTIGTVLNLQQFNTDLTDADATWDIGLIKFTSGNNDGIALEIGEYLNASGQITLSLLAPYTIVLGDTFDVYPGCDKTAVMCSTVYNNIVNMRAEPFGLNSAAAAAVGTPGAGLVTGDSTTSTAPAGRYALFIFAAGNAPPDGVNVSLFLSAPPSGNHFSCQPTPDSGTGDVWTFHRLSANTGFLDCTFGGKTVFSPYASYEMTTASEYFLAPVGAISNIAYGSPTPNRDAEAANANTVSLAAAEAVGNVATSVVSTLNATVV